MQKRPRLEDAVELSGVSKKRADQFREAFANVERMAVKRATLGNADVMRYVFSFVLAGEMGMANWKNLNLVCKEWNSLLERARVVRCDDCSRVITCEWGAGFIPNTYDCQLYVCSNCALSRHSQLGGRPCIVISAVLISEALDIEYYILSKSGKHLRDCNHCLVTRLTSCIPSILARQQTLDS